MAYTILNGNNIEVLKTFPDNHFDSIVTDPPYGISFLGKDWDTFRNSRVTKNSTVTNLGSGMRMTTATENLNFQLWCEQWAQECFRVLKPGGYMLSFCAARMYHRMTVGLEDAGFEIRDQIMWIYSSGFPKSQDVGKSIQRSLGVKEYEQVAVDTTKNSGFGMTDHARVRAGEDWSTPAATVKKVIATDPAAKQWSGWGTALKPAHEPIALARKPLSRDNSIARNCQQWGTGALNIDATRVGDEIFDTSQNRRTTQDDQLYDGGWSGKEGGELVKGRFPSNVIGDIAEPYQKYFYSPKVSRRERHVGFEQQPSTKQLLDSVGGYFCDTQGNAIEKTDDRVTMCYVPGKGVIFIHGLMEALKELGRNLDGNNHPTVKPIELMKYLIKLITPPGGHVLDPFNGSGSTGMAAVELDYDYTGIELDPAYVEIARRRIAAWYATTHPLEATGLFE